MPGETSVDGSDVKELELVFLVPILSWSTISLFDHLQSKAEGGTCGRHQHFGFFCCFATGPLRSGVLSTCGNIRHCKL